MMPMRRAALNIIFARQRGAERRHARAAMNDHFASILMSLYLFLNADIAIRR